jgi:N-acyl amino acid synthase of PEP-CTERM/exosortase system
MFWLHLLNPANAFRKHFELVLADSPKLREEVYRIRHSIYCEELGFEAVNALGQERDEHDRHSRHLLVRCITTGEWAGCIRLVLTSRDRPELRLPSEPLWVKAVGDGSTDAVPFPRENVAEISRLAIVPKFRRRRRVKVGLDTVAQAEFGTPAHPRAPYLQLSLYLGVIALAHRLGVHGLLLLTEPRLAAHFRKLGFPIRQIGGPVEHRGTRVLSVAEVEYAVRHLPSFMLPLYRVIDAQVADDLDLSLVVDDGYHRLARRRGRIHRLPPHGSVVRDGFGMRPGAPFPARAVPLHIL